MSLIGTSTNYKKVESPTRRYWLFNNVAYRDESECTYEWRTDGDGYYGALINPESLGADWACSMFNCRIPFGKQFGVYTEVWVKNGTWIYP